MAPGAGVNTLALTGDVVIPLLNLTVAGRRGRAETVSHEREDLKRVAAVHPPGRAQCPRVGRREIPEQVRSAQRELELPHPRARPGDRDGTGHRGRPSNRRAIAGALMHSVTVYAPLDGPLVAQAGPAASAG